MVLESKQTTVAYRCPHCGAGVLSAVGLFSLSADMVKLKCDCGHSEMTVVQCRDGKVRLTVPCIFCPNPHVFTVSRSLFYGKELFVLPCPYSDVNICIIGEINRVKAELARTELELLDIMEENGISDFSVLHQDEQSVLTDPQIFDIVMFVIHDLEAEGKITCRCPDGDGEYEAEVLDDAIRVSCTKCGAERLIPTDSCLGAHAFLNCDSLHLE
ncbi:MAG: hypothetical protein SO125_06845 [Eubacteriales bacterium]|nr:hypothetical protein [Eubacteriales bacterium]MDY4898662.1 hypothetical protein [Eubacteriales bacterium]